MKPADMVPGKEYVGFTCEACGKLFPIAGPLEAPADKPVQVGARGPLAVECPFCRHKASYSVERIKRLHAASARP